VTPSVGHSIINMYFEYIFIATAKGRLAKVGETRILDDEKRDQCARIRLHLHGLFFMPLEVNHQPIAR
jgi:hypothetical protein